MKLSKEYFGKLWTLFSSFFLISSLVVGGGLAMLPAIEEEFVHKKKFLSPEDMLDMISLTQTMPGIIAVNSAVFVGIRVAGFLGAVVATLGAIVPSFTAIVIIATFFPTLNASNPIAIGAFSGVRSCVAALITVTAIRTALRSIKNPLDAILASIIFVLAIADVRPMWLILSMLPVGWIILAFSQRVERGKECGK